MLELDPKTGYLPPGEHEATLTQLQEVFATNLRRKEIMTGLRRILAMLLAKDVKRVWVDGSFVTDKMRPSDVDVVFEPGPSDDVTSWGPLAPAGRLNLKHLYRVDLWAHPSPQPNRVGPGTKPIVEWFKTDRDGVPKGIVKLDLAENWEEIHDSK